MRPHEAGVGEGEPAAVGVKFCGLTRPQDAEEAARLGARYVGAVFAAGPRRLDAEHAAPLLAAARDLDPTIGRVGVFAGHSDTDVLRTAGRAGLDVLQLHGDSDPEAIVRIRELTGCVVWAVYRVGPELDSGLLRALADAADAVLLDALVPGRLGGAGVALPWEELAPIVAAWRRPATPLVLAGGLTPENVGAAIAALRPGIVDVSSGVEHRPGIKDPDRMRAFADAVRRAARSLTDNASRTPGALP